MGEERLKILKMLEEGKITADEAARLLEGAEKAAAFDGADERAEGRPFGEQRARKDDFFYTGETFDSTKKFDSREKEETKEGAGAEGGTSAKFEEFARDMGRKFGAVMRDLEPKLRKLTEAAAEGAANAAGAVRAGIDKSRERNRERARWRAEHTYARPEPPRREPGYSSTPPKPPYRHEPVYRDDRASGTFEKTFELPVTEPGARLSIAGLNGNVRVKGYNGGVITATVRYKPRRGGASPDFSTYGGKFILTWDEDDFKSVSVDAYVPSKAFDSIGLSTDNGAVDVSVVETGALRVDATNGAVVIENVIADEIVSESQNGAVEFRNIFAGKASVEGFNGRITAENIEAARLKLSTFNGALDFRAARLSRYADYIWDFESANGKLGITLPGGAAYHIKAHTALADVRLAIPDMEFAVNDRHTVEARSRGFESAPVKVMLNAETSNAPLVIN